MYIHTKVAICFFAAVRHTYRVIDIASLAILEFVIEVKDESEAVSDGGSNAVKHIVGMGECLALVATGQDGAIFAKVVQLAALFDGRVVVD